MIVTWIRTEGDGCGYVTERLTLRNGRKIKAKIWLCVERGKITYPIKSSLFVDAFTWPHVYEVN